VSPFFQQNPVRLFSSSSPLGGIDPKIDYYKVLGLQMGASDSQIKQGFYKLAKEHHPDAIKGKS